MCDEGGGRRTGSLEITFKGKAGKIAPPHSIADVVSGFSSRKIYFGKAKFVGISHYGNIPSETITIHPSTSTI